MLCFIAPWYDRPDLPRAFVAAYFAQQGRIDGQLYWRWVMRFIGTLVVIAAILSASALSASSAYAGPCAAQIAQIEQQINTDNLNVSERPSAPQTIGAQLGHQPTPATVQSGEREAGALARTALNRVREADGAGNAAACREALAKLKDLYGLP
jgi:hypothetical protein